MSASEADKALLKELLCADPGIPRSNPTIPYWTHVEHPLASTQSASLLELTDVAVIGSGITGASFTHHLLRNSKFHGHVTVLEARKLCSGATGRNGGNLLSHGGLGYSDLEELVGPEMSHKIIDFTLETVRRTKAAADELALAESEVRAVTRVHCYRDEDLFERAKRSLKRYTENRPKLKDIYQIIDGERATKEYGVHNVAGAILHPGNAIWPYRFITKVWEQLLEGYRTSLAVETNTPVTKIDYDQQNDSRHPYTLYTPRGVLRASHVVHATNAYSGHLFPALRGAIYPYNEAMTVQDLTSQGALNHGASRSWAVVQKPLNDRQSKTRAPGLLYLHQNAQSGYYFFGGGRTSLSTTFNADDSKPNSLSAIYLQAALRDLFDLGKENDNDDHALISTWTGIIGMTADHMPLVGQVPGIISGRGAHGEWIAAGFNGMGMSMCWSTGDALAQMLLEEKVPDWFPQAFLLSEQRLQTMLTIERALQAEASLLPPEHEDDE